MTLRRALLAAFALCAIGSFACSSNKDDRPPIQTTGGSAGNGAGGGGTGSGGSTDGGVLGDDGSTDAFGDALATDGAGCTFQTCAGCCDVNNVCQAGNSAGACGLNAQLCVACVTNQTCAQGFCQ